MKLRKGARKIAFLGSAITSRSSAPFNDPEWEIWATGPGCHNDPEFKNQFHRWFELHNMSENDPALGNVIDLGYYEWLQSIAAEKVVYFRPPLYKDLKGEEFPWDEIHSRHSGFFLDSTVAWMVAFAYEFFEPDEVGLWGIDFATDAERMEQRKGTKHFLELFKLKGVKVFIPDVSDMSFDPAPYPDLSKLRRKVNRHLALLDAETAKLQTAIDDMDLKSQQFKEELARHIGTRQALQHMKDNWS